MGKKLSGSKLTKLALLCLLSCSLAFIFIPTTWTILNSGGDKDNGDEGCICKGVENLELWGPTVNSGEDFLVNSAQECCKACKDICHGNHDRCLCDTWVFCGNKQTCGEKFGECWLKKQNDTLVPHKIGSGYSDKWTSGLVFPKGEGMFGLETEYGTIHIQLLPECSPHSVDYMLQIFEMRRPSDSHFFRAESRGQLWDSQGDHIMHASFGPPYGLLQGTFEVAGVIFKNISTEFCPTIKRGSVAWVGSGPEFFISLANHGEWKRGYTVFGLVHKDDMFIADKIAELPTKLHDWNGTNVSVLNKYVPFKIRRI